MPKFLFLYQDPVELPETPPSPDQMQAALEKWFTWLGKGKEEGWVVAMGDPLEREGKIVRHDHSIVDGPLPEAKEIVGGYSIISADGFDQACEYAKGCPIFEMGGSVEVREIADLGAPS